MPQEAWDRAPLQIPCKRTRVRWWCLSNWKLPPRLNDAELACTTFFQTLPSCFQFGEKKLKQNKGVSFRNMRSGREVTRTSLAALGSPSRVVHWPCWALQQPVKWSGVTCVIPGQMWGGTQGSRPHQVTAGSVFPIKQKAGKQDAAWKHHGSSGNNSPRIRFYLLQYLQSILGHRSKVLLGQGPFMCIHSHWVWWGYKGRRHNLNQSRASRCIPHSSTLGMLLSLGENSVLSTCERGKSRNRGGRDGTKPDTQSRSCSFLSLAQPHLQIIRCSPSLYCITGALLLITWI